ncbi:hypothetical protein ACN38_g8163 [Penicillium nordicum]|uniref:Uncharacterized protein n=1 Tax=Penicillium nordicum TaxID=229535 RepID=A0A0M8P590_9EURO|nr:hypothetical protein ACN38_g8163 [Penicillium nordicum]
MKLSNGSLPPLAVCHYLFSSTSILIDADRTNLTVQIAVHPYRFQARYLLKGSVMVIQVFIFSAVKYSGILRQQYYYLHRVGRMAEYFRISKALMPGTYYAVQLKI